MRKNRLYNKMISERQILKHTDKGHRKLVKDTMYKLWFGFCHLLDLKSNYRGTKDDVFNYIVRSKIYYNILCKYSKGYRKRFRYVVDYNFYFTFHDENETNLSKFIKRMTYLIMNGSIEDLEELYDYIKLK